MIGLFAVMLWESNIDKYTFPTIEKADGFLVDEYRSDKFYIKRKTLNKFPEDQFFHKYSNCFVATDMVLLNKSKMEEKHNQEFIELLGDTLKLKEVLSECRGSFSGIIYNEELHQLSAFTDQIASKPLFYMNFQEGIVISSEVKEISLFCKNNKLPIKLDLIGAYSMLTYGYMYRDHTMIEGVTKVRDGCCLNVLNHHSSIEVFHTISFDVEPKSEKNNEQRLEMINQLFREAVDLQARKNLEHHYTDVIPLSSGMDCRMAAYVYNDITHRSALNFTYSETGEYDYIYPPQIAHDLKNRWIFKSLDNGLDLFDIDKAIDLSDGLIYYAWPAQLYDFLNLVNTEQWGIIHTGVLGDVVLGTFQKGNEGTSYYIGAGAFSTYLIDKLKKLIPDMEEEAYEAGMIRNRGINGASLGYSLTFRHFAESMSPFLYVDFMDYCFSIPYKERQHHDLYYSWVNQYYPAASEYKHNGVEIKGKATLKVKGKEYRWRAIPDLIKNTIRCKINPRYGMNPFQAWFDNNEDLREVIDSYFHSNIDLLDAWNELYEDTKSLYNNGTAKEKIQAISLVGSVKMLIGGIEK